jgi:hypothetical protein
MPLTLTKEEVHSIAVEVVTACRKDVDLEILKLHTADKENAWTEQRAEDIAEKAARMAVKQITDNFYMSVGKKTIITIGAITVGVIIMAKDFLKSALGLR